MEYKAPPERFGLTPAEGDAIHNCYVERTMTMEETRRMVERKLDCFITDEKIRRFINGNGWKRSRRYYASRSPWNGLNRACIEESKAKRRGHL